MRSVRHELLLLLASTSSYTLAISSPNPDPLMCLSSGDCLLLVRLRNAHPVPVLLIHFDQRPDTREPEEHRREERLILPSAISPLIRTMSQTKRQTEGSNRATEWRCDGGSRLHCVLCRCCCSSSSSSRRSAKSEGELSGDRCYRRRVVAATVACKRDRPTGNKG